MGKSNNKIVSDKMENILSEELFFNDLLSVPEYVENTTEEQESLKRDFMYKRKALQTILSLEVPGSTLNGDEGKEMKSKEIIGSKIDDDELLFGYTFYVSSNPEFKRNWNYMRKQLDKYADFLFNAKRFFKFVLRDINALTDELQGIQEVHIVFDGIVDVAFSDDNPRVRAKILWEHFHNIANVGHANYMLSVMIKETTLVVCNCSYKDETDILRGKIKETRVNFKL